MTQLEVNIFDYESEVIDGYFYDNTDAKYALDASMERAQEEGIDDYYEIVVTPFCPTDADFQDPLARWCPSSGVYEVKDDSDE